MISLKSSGSRALERELKTHAGKMRKAGARALNKTAAQSKTFASKDVRQTLNLPASRVGKAIFVNRAKGNNLAAQLRVRRRSVPAVYYRGWKAVKSVRGRRTSTTAKKTRLLKRGGGKGGVTVKFRKDKTPVHFPHGFVAVMPGGHLGLFIRKGPKSYPIREIMGPNVQAIFTEHMTLYVNQGRKSLKRIYEHEVAFELSR